MGNAPLDGPEPAKLARLRERLEAAAADGREDWLELLGGWCADHTPAGPRGALDALCVHTSKKIVAVFPEVGANEKILDRMAKETGVRIAKPLLVDAPSQEYPTYLEVFRYNVEVIVEALKP